MRHIRMSVIAGAIITILAGIWLFLFPLSSLGTVVHMLGLAVLLYGVVGIATYFMRLGGFWPVGGLTRSVVITAVGLLILSSPGFIISIFPILAGIVIAAGGVDNLLLALAVRKAGGEWVVLLALSVITIATGVFLFSNPFAVQSTLVRVTGVVLVYNGFVSLFGGLRI